MIKKILYRLAVKFFKYDKRKKRLYKIGNLKHQNARIDAFSPMFVEIGDDFVSAPGSVILSHDASPFMITGKYRVEKTTVGNRVFLGANAVILPGVSVGDDAIIGAGSVVTKNVPPGTVVAGNPARVMCTVEEYFEKCEMKGTLHTPPSEFDRIREDLRPSPKALLEFQENILKSYKNNDSN